MTSQTQYKTYQDYHLVNPTCQFTDLIRHILVKSINQQNTKKYMKQK